MKSRQNKNIKVSNEYRLIGSRRAADNHLASKLLVSKEFQDDLENTRKHFLIPIHLTESDLYIRYITSDDHVYDDLFGNRYTHDILNEENRLQFKKAIIDILEKYKLGINFFTWVQWLLLYREVLPDGIVPDRNLLKRIGERFSNIGEIFRMSWNTQEKKMFLFWYREVNELPVTGRIPKDKIDDYDYFKGILNRKKSENRKPRGDHSNDSKVYEMHGTTSLLGLEQVKNTYLRLAVLLSDDEEATAEQDLKGAQTMRKRNERLKKQINKLEK